jgi:hypothetical protein
MIFSSSIVVDVYGLPNPSPTDSNGFALTYEEGVKAVRRARNGKNVQHSYAN